MKAACIICEYNPVHVGHAFHIAETKRITGRPVICLMSGSFVQRGDAAVFPKHLRARSALMAGADLVLQLDITASLSSAELFAESGVRLADALGVCDTLSFGSECGDISRIQGAASALLDPETDGKIPHLMESGMSYPAARAKAASDFGDVLRNPNDNLGVEYVKALMKTGSSVTPVTVKREGGGHFGELSSSAIREKLREGSFDENLMPKGCAELFKASHPVFADDNVILSRLRFLSQEAYGRLPFASEGLGDRLMKYASTESSVSAVADMTKTKRYTHSRIRRMIMCAAVGITADDMSPEPYYIRVLGANDVGRELLRGISDSAEIPVITKPADGKKLSGKALRRFGLDCAATDIYSLFMRTEAERRGGGEFRISPVMM